jgi:hypothetical protein
MAPKTLKPDVPLHEWEHRASSDEQGRWWVGFAKFLLLVLFATLLFVLGETMVRHHFFTGGAMNYHNHPGGP